MNMDVKLLTSLLEASVGVEERSENLNKVAFILQSDSEIDH